MTSSWHDEGFGGGGSQPLLGPDGRRIPQRGAVDGSVELFLGQLSRRFPAEDPARLRGLAAVWAVELALVSSRMLAIGEEEYGVIPHEARGDAVWELASWQLWLTNKIIDKKTEATSISEIDAAAEEHALDSDHIRERIENTARVAADHIWAKLIEQWHKTHRPIISSRRTRVIDGKKKSGPKRHHYSPRFSNRHWASGVENRVRVYSRATYGSIRSKDVGYSSWGWERFLYSQRLERYLHLVEGDAKIPYDKLLNMIPFNERDQRHWVAFLAVQVIRTPSFVLNLIPRTRRVVELRQLRYGTDTGSLRRAYETLFTDPGIFTVFYNLITSRRWQVLVAADGAEFVRSDEPVLTLGSEGAGTWRMFYALTPKKCFAAGPERTDKSGLALTEKLSAGQVMTLNAAFAEMSRTTAIARTSADDSELRGVLARHLGAGRSRSGEEEPFWG